MHLRKSAFAVLIYWGKTKEKRNKKLTRNCGRRILVYLAGVYQYKSHSDNATVGCSNNRLGRLRTIEKLGPFSMVKLSQQFGRFSTNNTDEKGSGNVYPQRSHHTKRMLSCLSSMGDALTVSRYGNFYFDFCRNKRRENSFNQKRKNADTN